MKSQDRADAGRDRDPRGNEPRALPKRFPVGQPDSNNSPAEGHKVLQLLVTNEVTLAHSRRMAGFFMSAGSFTVRKVTFLYSSFTAVDTMNERKVGEIKINSDAIEALALEKSGPYLYANITGEDAVAEINHKNWALAATWPIGSVAKHNAPLAYDPADNRLFVVTRDPGKLIVLDSQSGKIITSMPCVGFGDDAVYDVQNKRIYIAGSGAVSVVQQQDPDHYKLVATIPGSYRAKTAILVPELDRYYLAVPHHGTHEAEVRAYAVMP